MLVAGAWLGSLLPDADRAGSRIYRARRLERRAWFVRILGMIARLPLRLLLVLKHRGVTHSLLACAVASIASGLIVSLVVPAAGVHFGAGVAIGYLAHIAADACTPSGVALFVPVSRRRRWLLPAPVRIPTGSLREFAFTAIVAVAAVAATAAFAG